jgi:RimJ/RimL family protein N-acetyltransferase
MDVRDDAFAERHTKDADDPNSVNWSIAYEDETVGFTGLFDIDWIARDCESGIFIGRSDLYGRGIASEAIRLRTEFAWREMTSTVSTTGFRFVIGAAAGRTRRPATRRWD